MWNPFRSYCVPQGPPKTHEVPLRNTLRRHRWCHLCASVQARDRCSDRGLGRRGRAVWRVRGAPEAARVRWLLIAVIASTMSARRSSSYRELILGWPRVRPLLEPEAGGCLTGRRQLARQGSPKAPCVVLPRQIAPFLYPGRPPNRRRYLAGLHRARCFQRRGRCSRHGAPHRRVLSVGAGGVGDREECQGGRVGNRSSARGRGPGGVPSRVRDVGALRPRVPCGRTRRH